MTTTITKIPNEAHMAKVRDARRAAGLPVNLMAHPFAALRREAA